MVNIFKAETLQDSLLPLIYMSIPFGIAPRLPTTGKFVQFLSLVFSLFGLAFGVAILVILILVNQHFVSSENIRRFMRDVPSQLTSCSIIIAVLATVTTHLPYRRNNTFANIIESLARIDEELNFDKSRYYTKTKMILCAIDVGIPIIYFSYLIWTSYRHDWSVVFILVPGFMSHLIIIQYIVIAALLKQRFFVINKYLMNAFGFADIGDEDLSAFEISNVSTIRGIVSNQMVRKNKGSLLETLDMLQEKHSTLSELIEGVNSVYALSNLTFVLEMVVGFTRNIYGVIDMMYGGYTTWAKESLILLVANMCMATTKVFVFAVVCDEASAVARRPVVLAGTLKLHLGADEQDVSERLDLFARHIQNLRFSFTAYSLVTFDRGLLGDIIGTVVMHTIILMQFAISDTPTKTITGAIPQMTQNISFS